MSNECNTSIDCFELDGTPKFCYEAAEFSSEVNFCDCTNWYGWKGENCDESSPQLVFYLISQIFIVLFSMFVMLTLIRILYIYAYYGTKFQRKLDPIVITALFIFASLFFTFLHAFIVIPALVNPTNFELVTYDEIHQETEDVGVKYEKVATFSLFLAASFFFLTTLQVFYTWYQIIEQVSMFDSFRASANVKRILFAIKVIIIVYSLVAVVVIATDERVIAAVITAVLGFGLSISYPLVYFYISKKFAKLKVCENEFVANTVNLIHYCSFAKSIALVVSSLAMIVMAALYVDIKEKLAPGDFNYVLFLREIVIYCGLYMMAVKSWYVNTMLARNPMPKSCILKPLWDKWDSKHYQVYSKATKTSDFVTSTA